MIAYRVRNWNKYQHYKDRNPPWIKLHYEMLTSQDWVSLSDASRVLAIACMLIASRHEGGIPGNVAYLKRVAYLNSAPDFKPLIECGFLEPLADASMLQADARPETEAYSKETDTPPTPLSKMTHIALPPEWLQWAKQERGWPEQVVSDVWSQFKEYWTNGKGRSTKRSEWDSTWRNWCRKENLGKPRIADYSTAERDRQARQGAINL